MIVRRDWDEDMPIPVHELIESHRDAENRAALQSLGYTEDGIGIDPEEDETEDPRLEVEGSQ